jgi:hypothetical protein
MYPVHITKLNPSFSFPFSHEWIKEEKKILCTCLFAACTGDGKWKKNAISSSRVQKKEKNDLECVQPQLNERKPYLCLTF